MQYIRFLLLSISEFDMWKYERKGHSMYALDDKWSGEEEVHNKESRFQHYFMNVDQKWTLRYRDKNLYLLSLLINTLI